MIAFWILAPIMVLAALGILFVRKAVHAALLLAVVMISLAVLYAVLEAPFLFAVQNDPEDDLPRRALTDYLEEVGDARAVLVRDSLAGDLTALSDRFEAVARLVFGGLGGTG